MYGKREVDSDVRAEVHSLLFFELLWRLGLQILTVLDGVVDVSHEHLYAVFLFDVERNEGNHRVALQLHNDDR